MNVIECDESKLPLGILNPFLLLMDPSGSSVVGCVQWNSHTGAPTDLPLVVTDWNMSHIPDLLLVYNDTASSATWWFAHQGTDGTNQKREKLTTVRALSVPVSIAQGGVHQWK